MDLLTHNWSFDPFLIVVVGIVIFHEIGLAHLASRSRAERSVVRRHRSLYFYGGLAVLLIGVESPIDYWASSYLWVHMIQHLLLMFAAPMLIVAGAPWLVLVHGLPVGFRRSAGRQLILARWSSPLRALGRWISRPAVGLVGFSAVMVFWHLPGPLDLAERNQMVHIWVMHGSFVAIGILFWLQFMPSYPFRPALGPLERGAALFLTNVVMFVLAMSLSLFATHSWYSAYQHVPGVTLSPLADQQIGAGILWVCGDFWCFPMFFRTVLEYFRTEKGPGPAFERFVHRPAVDPRLLEPNLVKPVEL